jgi:predicted transcriptional regulator
MGGKAGDWDDFPEKGRTLYLGSTSSPVRARLYEKGLVTRDRQGRGFAYRATLSESELAARRMGEVLKSAADRKAVLVGFVGSLTKRDVKALRAMVQEHGP